MRISDKFMFTGLAVVVVMLIVIVSLSACASEPSVPGAQQRTTDVAESRENIYEPINFLDFNNWNQWAEMSDNPTTILWCTFFPATHEKITVPIVGKFTDSGKTPFVTKFAYDQNDNSSGLVEAELADPFAMYGTSSEFQYGFDPAGNFSSWAASIPSTCFSEPKVFQSMDATIVIKVDDRLAEITDRAQAALEAGDDAEAIRILQEAE